MVRTQTMDPAMVNVFSGKRRTLVAIPCYNEELAIGSMVLQARKHADVVLVIDDGSKDRTVEIARAAGAEVLVHEKNSGKGAAIRNAFRYAKENGFDALVVMDGDGQHDPEEIPQMLEPVVGRNGRSVDIALGFRFGDKTEMPKWRRVGKRVLDYATAAGGAGMVTDSQCGYRAFGRRAIEEMEKRLQADGFGVESEQLVYAREAGLTMENVNITCKYDGIDGSTKGPLAHATGVLASIVNVITMKRPLLTVGLPSVLLVLASLALAMRALLLYPVGAPVFVIWTISTAFMVLVGATGIFFALTMNMILVLEKRIK